MYQPRTAFTCWKQSKGCHLFGIQEVVYSSKPMLTSEFFDRELFGRKYYIFLSFPILLFNKNEGSYFYYLCVQF